MSLVILAGPKHKRHKKDEWADTKQQHNDTHNGHGPAPLIGNMTCSLTLHQLDTPTNAILVDRIFGTLVDLGRYIPIQWANNEVDDVSA
jgi:hypothetical protein